MPEYAIMFDDEWVREHTHDELVTKGAASRAVLDEMRAAGVLVWSNGGLDERDFVTTVDAVDGPDGVRARFVDEPYRPGDHLGGICVIDVPDDEAARSWAGRLAVVLQWPQEVYRFRGPGEHA